MFQHANRKGTQRDHLLVNDRYKQLVFFDDVLNGGLH